MDTKKVVKEAVDKITDEFSTRIAKLDFNRTKKWFWVRVKDGSIDFIHLHQSGSSYGGPINYSISFRVHIGNRVMSDSRDFIHLNGPTSNDADYFSDRFHLRFNAKTGSTYERCLDDLERFTIDVGEPWFQSNENHEIESDKENRKLAYKLLGIRVVKN